jgi:hypothetical protein
MLTSASRKAQKKLLHAVTASDHRSQSAAPRAGETSLSGHRLKADIAGQQLNVLCWLKKGARATL